MYHEFPAWQRAEAVVRCGRETQRPRPIL